MYTSFIIIFLFAFFTIVFGEITCLVDTCKLEQKQLILTYFILSSNS